MQEPIKKNTPISELAEQIVARASGTQLTAGNHIEILLNSEANFPAWESALRAAEHSICIEMYIFAVNDFGQTVRQILLEKLQQGVVVVLVYDWVGSIWGHYRGFFKPLVEAGAHVKPYNPIGWISGIGLLSRNHRKSFIIDEKIAFVSGLCISSAWNGKPESGVSAWRDTGVMIQGEAVAQVMAAFEDTLLSQGSQLPEQLTGYAERIRMHFAEQSPGEANLRVIATTPANINMMRLDLNAIGLARRNLWLTDAYFMPTRLYVQALINAAKAGVDVRLLVPRTSDIKWIGTVSRTQYRHLLEAGVRIFEWNGTMIHAKSALADGTWARVGSTNLNLSSWYANRELDVSIEDAATVACLQKIFLQDLENATEVILNEEQHTQLIKERQRLFKRHQTLHKGQAKSVARQMMQLGHVFDPSFYGTRLVAESEAWSYITIGIVLLLSAVLIFFVQQLVVWPLLVLLVVGGMGTLLAALKQLRQFRRQKVEQEAASKKT